VLTGTVTDTARTIHNDQGHQAELVQLHVDQDLGGFNGYSGSPVWVPGSAGGHRAAVGVLVEQTLLRVKKQPGQGSVMATNVLWAAPLPVSRGRRGRARPGQVGDGMRRPGGELTTQKIFDLQEFDYFS